MNHPGVLKDKKTSGYSIHEMNLAKDHVLTAVVEVPSGSDWFAGHFPGNPILPGIAQMGMVVELMGQTMGTGLKLEGFKRVRFKQLIKPDTMISVLVKPQGKKKGIFFYSLTVAGEVASSGFIRVSQKQQQYTNCSWT